MKQRSEGAIDLARGMVKRLEQRFGGLPIVLANIADQWAGMTAKQRALVKQVMPETQVWEEVVWQRKHKRRVLIPVIHRRISTLWERSQVADVQDFIAEALDQWEDRRAANDELAHPDGDEPRVEVALDNQTHFLEWVAQGALSATAKGRRVWCPSRTRAWPSPTCRLPPRRG